ncbi:hypothetical protein AB8B21_02630 [Tardiphaga sp. 866_E4_N2_1]|jgi:hypothetical protein|uniref:hypothetical protein n=1 Tax=unclassified Tardiphaga TaxID=2631404 RepID=UPI003F22F62F
MAHSDWHRVRIELTAPRNNGSATAEHAKAEPDHRPLQSISDTESNDALLEHIALALADRVDPSI